MAADNPCPDAAVRKPGKNPWVDCMDSGVAAVIDQDEPKMKGRAGTCYIPKVKSIKESRI